MGWFARGGKPDAIGDLCQLLVGRPWEWAVGVTGTKKQTLTHLSGVWVGWSWDGYSHRPEAWLSLGGGIAAPMPPADAKRLWDAIQGNATARVSCPRVPFDDAAKALAKSVLETGDRTAARALADMVCELVSEGEGT